MKCQKVIPLQQYKTQQPGLSQELHPGTTAAPLAHCHHYANLKNHLQPRPSTLPHLPADLDPLPPSTSFARTCLAIIESSRAFGHSATLLWESPLSHI